MTYEEYIHSSKWRRKRKVALERAGHKCQLCASRECLQVHHNDYARLFNELPTDLVVLCDRCHSHFHRAVDQRTRTPVTFDEKWIPALPDPPLLPDSKPIIITEELILRLQTEKGGFLKSGLQMLGVRWPPIRGWKKRIIGETVMLSKSRVIEEILAAESAK